MRLNKFISHNTSYSRREADRLIESGAVNLFKSVIKDFSYDVKDDDKIFINGKYIKRKIDYTIIVYNKPKGELVTKKDDKGRKTIYHAISSRFKGFVYVGRLDFASEGLLLLTDSPKIAHILSTHDIKKGYKLKIKGNIDKNIEDAMKEGIELEDATAGAYEGTNIESMSIKPFSSYDIKKSTPLYSTLKVHINEGQNRELRRFFSYFGKEVVDLKRFSFGDINLNALPTGKVRYLSSDEYKYVRNILKKRDKDDKSRDNYQTQNTDD